VAGASSQSWKRPFRRINRPLSHGLAAGAAIWIIASLGLFYLWHAAREAQLDAVQSELKQLARTAATLVDGDLHRTIRSQAQAGSSEHLALLEPLVKFHKAASDIIYVYTAVIDRGRIYYVLGTDYLYRVQGDNEAPELIMAPHDTFDPTLRRALERQEIAVNDQPVQEAVRSYMSAYAPFFDRGGRFVGVVGVDMWVRDFDARVRAIRRAGIGAFAAVTLLSVLAGLVVIRLSRAALRARLRDRAAQARLAAAKRQAEIRAQDAQAAARSKGELLAVMSHEMRTPMSGVLGFANLLLDTPLSREQREFAQIVQRSGDALLTVINDVLDYSKIEAGRMTVERIDMALHDVCEEVRAILQSAALERGVAIVVRFDPRLPKFIKGDPVRIRQVLLNLAGNAVKFTEGGSVAIGAEALDPGRVKISVTDTGIGIPTEQMATLFQQYAQGDTARSRRYGGTGLGLAISKTLVELMGGEIGAQSTVGAGSTFWFVLPLNAGVEAAASVAPPARVPGPTALCEAPPATAPPATAPPATAPPATAPPTIPVLTERAAPASSEAASSRPVSSEPEHTREAAASRANVSGVPTLARPASAAARLLLVEDNFVNQRVALYMLAKLGYDVDLANDGREALHRLGKERYDLVLMDCQMPEMDGFEATRLIRDPASAVLDHDVPIVAMTANAFPEDRARSLECGMSDFLSKPVDRAALSAMIVKWLRPAKEPAAAAG
jgi:signal transduction histidine kinase/ActR/RegA family two-component response regulator